MGDMGEDFRAMRDESRERRAANRAGGAERLAKEGIAFESRNDGAHLILKHAKRGAVDFWPGTGKWRLRGTTVSGRGVANLVKWFRATYG